MTAIRVRRQASRPARFSSGQCPDSPAGAPRAPKAVATALGLSLLVIGARSAEAQLDSGEPHALIPLPGEQPPVLSARAALRAISPLWAARLCPSGSQCVFGGGFGLGGGMARRWATGAFMMLTYEAWLLDSAGVYEVFVIQNLAVEVRHTWFPDRRLHPLVGIRAGMVLAGDGFRPASVGVLAEPVLGVEAELTARTSVTLALTLSLLELSPFRSPNDRVQRGGFGVPAVALGFRLGLGLLEAL